MSVERSAGIILFRTTPQGRKYLVIRSARKASKISPIKITREFWDFPKGWLEKGETGLDAAAREAKEEVGIDKFDVVPGFKMTTRYFTRREGKAIPKFVVMFLAEVKTPKVKLSWEHDKHEWLTYKEASARVTLYQMKEILKTAEKFLKL